MCFTRNLNGAVFFWSGVALPKCVPYLAWPPIANHFSAFNSAAHDLS